MQAEMQVWARRLGWALGILVLGYLALIVWMHPWYGVADDGTHLYTCDVVRERGFWNSLLLSVQGDLSWGMFRPLYYLYVKVVYCATDGHPTALYLINALISLASALAVGFAAFRIAPVITWSKKLYLAIFLLITLSIYRFHDSFFIAAMQEKLVLFAGALALYVLAKSGGKRRLFWDCLLIALCLLIGFSTKAQFLLFLPGIFLLVLANGLDRRDAAFYIRVLFCGFMILVGMAAVKWIASQGSYTGGYSFAKLIENLFTRQGILLWGLGLLSLGLEIWFAIREGKGWSGVFRAMIPASMILSFVAIMAPWSLGDSYLLAPTAPLAAVCLLSLWQRASIHKTWPIFVALVLTASFMTFYRGYRGFGRWSDLNKVLFSQELEERVKANHLAFIPCMEGADLTQGYLRRFRGLEMKKTYKLEEGLTPTFAIADSALCKLPPEWKEKAVLVSKPLFPGSFALYDFKP